MKKFVRTPLILALIVFSILSAQAQTTGSIAGTVVDPNGAVVPNATVTVVGESGQEFTVVTADNGTYRIPAVQNGIYTLTVMTTTGFKKYVVTNVKVDVGLPTTVDAALEVGGNEQIVEVTSGGEVLQTETAAISRTITGRQITETPIASRDALDLVLLTPGANTVGRPRASSINGLPKGSLNISIDGVDVQDNLLRSSDGFFTYVRPRVDAIDEVTISTANPGAESGGDGAVQIRFVTKRGTNDYRGGVFYQHRNTALNANYFFLNRDGQRDAEGKALRQKIILNQFGGRLGGPLPFLNFGEGDDPLINSGKDKAFFFFNYEQFRQPESNTRTYTVLSPDAQAGNFSYLIANSGTLPTGCVSVSASQAQCTRNIYTIAAGTTQLATPDPTVAGILTRIRTAVGTTGTLTAITGNPNRQSYNFTPAGGQVRKFLALRFDFNLNKSNSLEFVTNQQVFDPSKDFLNSQDERFPGFPSYTQGSNRDSYSTALRSTFTNNLVNEARFAISTGLSTFSDGISAADFAYSGGNSIDFFTAAGVSTPYSRNSFSSRNTPTYDFTDSMTYLAGSHNINFGGQYKVIRSESIAIPRIVPTYTVGNDTNDAPLQLLFNSTQLPGSSTTQQAEARSLYAALTGRVTAFTSTAYLTADGTYQLNGTQEQTSKQITYGLFAQDSWKVRPNLTINYGIRWQPQGGYIILSDNYAQISRFEDVYGVSGVGNIFKPGTLTGRVPTVVGIPKGESAYPADNNNFAPSIGVVYSPGFDGKGILHSVFGSSGRSVFRGGYSISYVREGFALVGSIIGANPGGNLPASRSFALGNLTLGTSLRTANNPNLTPAPFSTTPSYPITLSTATSANAFDSNLKTGTVHSFSFGYQREIDKNTVVEFRYVGNRGYDLFRQHNINELNTIENGLADEFKIAQANLAANVAANRCQTGITAANCQYNFAYFGPGTGTSPVPISLAYITGIGAAGASTAANYQTAAAALFRNIAFAGNLNRAAPSVIAFGGNLEGAAARRANALNAGLPSNFFFVNPTTATAGAFIVDNSAKSWYDSGVIELRRRLSTGLRFQASYVWSKAQSDSFQSNSDNFANFSNRPNGLELAKNVAPFDITHAFKFDGTYDLPFGRGGAFFSNANGFVNALIGGFSLYPTIRWQSGSPFALGNVALVGITKQELQKEIKVRKDAVIDGVNVVTFLPEDIILNSRRAFALDPTQASGFGAQLGAPTGRYIAPATVGGCLQRYVGECGFNNLILYGPSYFKFDIAVSKKINFDEKRNFEIRATFLDALNQPNFRVGGWAADTVLLANPGSTFGQLGNGTAYQDLSTTNDPGGRLIDIMLRFNF